MPTPVPVESTERDWRAYGPVAAQHRASLHRTAMLLTGNPAAAEDLVSDTLLAVHRPWSAGRIDDFAAYARRTMTNRFSSDQRRDRTLARIAPRLIGRGTDEDAAITIDLRLPVLAALASLTDKQRAVVVLRYYEDLSVEQTAGALGVTTGTVKSTLHDALAKLERLLGEPRR